MHADNTQATRFRGFVEAFDALLAGSPPEREIVERGAQLLGDLVRHDDWLPASHSRAAADRYRQYLLHLDPAGRWAAVSFVWGPGQGTPIHDHTVWGLIGMLRGSEESQGYRYASPTRLVPAGAPVVLQPGDVEAVSPALGDIHQVRNRHDDRVSISIHVYGADIGAVERATYGEDGSRRPFVSGYSPLELS